MNSRNRNITIGVGLLVSSIGYFGIRSIQRNKLYKKILAKMGGGASGYDYSEFYNPTYWQTDFGVPVIYLDNKYCFLPILAILGVMGCVGGS